LVRKQATTSFEDSLTAQYRKIMKDIPADIWLGAHLTTLTKEHKDRCRDAIYRYIDLSNEQAFLHDKKRVSEEAWTEWRTGIKGNMELPAFKEVWTEVSKTLERGRLAVTSSFFFGARGRGWSLFRGAIR
jgi:hypothetical protein